MRLALYQPDIAQNTGTILRLAACMGVGADIIEPCGFIFNDSKMRRAGMDYIDQVEIHRHANWAAFKQSREQNRLVLLTTKSHNFFMDFSFNPDDILVLGRESAGVPEEVHNSVDACIKIPMMPQMRSLNIAISAAMVLSEALRQTKGFPNDNTPHSI